MDQKSPILDSDNESNTDILELDTDYDFPVEQDYPTTTVNHSIGSVWRDMVIGEQIEGCLTHLEVSSKVDGYKDMDDPNYKPPVTNEKKRKRDFLSFHQNKKLKNEECGFKSKNGIKTKKFHSNGDFNKFNYKHVNINGSVEKRDNTNNDIKAKSRLLPEIYDSEEKTNDQLLEELCKNLYEHNKILMLSVISKIDRKIILEKYQKTCLIEANGGQMIKNGDRRRTSGGIFFNLIKIDKTIPNSAKKDLFSFSQNNDIKKKKKREKIKQKKQQLKIIIDQDKKKAETLNKLNEELEMLTSPCVFKVEENCLNSFISNDN